MFPVGSAFASSFDLFDLPFQLHPVSVFSHPLFTRANYSVEVPEKESSDKAEKLKQLQRNGKICAVEETNGGGDRCGEKQQNFVDPLNASAIDERTNEHSANTKTLPSVPHLNGVPSDGFGPGPMAILATERLDNTLAERESEQWPLEGLDPQLVGHRPWKVLRQRILDTFSSATDRLSLESTFLRGNEATETQNSAEKRKLRKTISGETEKMRQRKNFAIEKHAQTVAKFNELTQDEWTRKLKELRRILLIKWEEEKRLECIKLTSEVAMLISTNISSAQFYPSQFVHVTDFLDLFGHLVYKRLLHRAAEERRGVGLGALPSHFDTNDVLEETRIKARNWFGKVNETVALLAPRIYLLTALLPCQRFMDPLAAIQENVLELCQSVKQANGTCPSNQRDNLRCNIRSSPPISAVTFVALRCD
ncbi:hypothetical protein niasHT_007235 [Heterodera trifolii]|uniref:Uncharacterized protein n=1 Tax=Heterodera trifolii TaxID=157864 RepID=A0ABD2LL25_9BILA